MKNDTRSTNSSAKPRFERFLNLNGVAGRMLVGIFLIGAVIPGGLALAQLAGLRAAWIGTLQQMALEVGAALLAIFVLLVIVEQVQDALLGAAHRRSLAKGEIDADAPAECPHCGSRNIKPFEHYCSVCGKELRW